MIAAGDTRLFRAVLAVGAASVVVFLAAPVGSVWQVAAWFAPLLLAATVLAVRTALSPAVLRLPLGLLLAGALAYLGLSVFWYLGPVLLGRRPEFPSALDAGYFAIYAVYAVFLVMVLHRRAHDRPAESRIALIDAVILTTAVSAPAWVWIVEPNLTNGTSAVSTAVAVLYPALNLLLFALAARLAVTGGFARSAPGALLLLWIAAQITGELFYGYQSANGTFEHGGPLTAGRVLAYAALAALAAHPGMAAVLQEPTGRDFVRRPGTDSHGTLFRRIRLALLLAGALVPLGLSTVVHEDYVLTLVVASAACAGLVTYRGALLSRYLNEQRRVATRLGEVAGQYRAILDTVGDGIYGVDRAGTVTFANPAAAAMLGYEPAELIGRNGHALFHREDDTGEPAEAVTVTHALACGVPQRSSTETLLRRDRTLLAVETVATPMLEKGRITGAVVSFRDITQRHEVDRLKSEFTSIVSHELRTPLTSIRGSLGLLASGVLGDVPEKGRRMLDIAVSNTDRLVRLINDILDLERINAGAISMEKQDIRIGELVDQTRDAMEALAAGAGVAVTVDADDTRLWADPDRMMQTLTNLVSNAIKFSEPGGTVHVSARRAGEDLLLSVRDEGRGIPPDRLEAVFERFEQVDSSDAREKGGTGLGLPICRSIVEQHGGRIWVESTLGEGSTFVVRLPAPAPADGAPAEQPGRTVPAVLVCDDDPAVRELVALLLQRRGFRVLAAASGEEALELAARERPVAILLDLIMPGLTGWETAVRLKAQPETEHIPVVMCSVLSPEEADVAPELAVAGWVDKPVDEDSLVAALETALSGDRTVTRVLVVEDDADLAGVLTAMFERHGVETFCASTGSDALRLSQQLLPDLLVLDLMLPDVDGFAVTDRLRRHERLHSVPLIVYTARDLDESQRDRLRLGDTRFFTKGRVSLADFEQCVIGLLPGADVQQEASLVR